MVQFGPGLVQHLGKPGPGSDRGSGKRIINFNVSTNLQFAQLSPTDIIFQMCKL